MNTIPHPTRCPHCHTITPGLPYLTKCPTCRHYTPATWRRTAHLTLFGAVVTLTVGAIVVSTDSTSDRGSVAEILRQADKDAVTRKHQEELTSWVTTELDRLNHGEAPGTPSQEERDRLARDPAYNPCKGEELSPYIIPTREECLRGRGWDKVLRSSRRGGGSKGRGVQ